jgi:hypothetical protein
VVFSADLLARRARMSCRKELGVSKKISHRLRAQVKVRYTTSCHMECTVPGIYIRVPESAVWFVYGNELMGYLDQNSEKC